MKNIPIIIGIILILLHSSSIPFASSNEISSNDIINIGDNNITIDIKGGLGITIEISIYLTLLKLILVILRL